MNNPIDIGRMYGLNGTGTHTMMNSPKDMNMFNRMVDISQMNDSQITDEMCMPMQNRSINVANEIINQTTSNTGQGMGNAQSTMQNESQIMNNSTGLTTYNNTDQVIKPQANVIFKNPYMQGNNNIELMNDLLRTHIGKMAEIEFLIGTNNMHVKQGQLTGMGSNYITLKELNTGRIIIADFHNIKFVTIYDDNYR